MGKDLDFYKMIGVAPNASQGAVDHACSKLEEVLRERVAENDEAALQQLATLGRIRQVIGNPEIRRQYDTLRTSRGHADDLLLVSAISVEDPAFEEKLGGMVESIAEQLRKPPERIGGTPAGKEGVELWQQEMWNMLGDEAADADDPEPIFREHLQRLLIEYGADNIPSADAIPLNHNSREAFTIALRIVGIALRPHAREISAYCMGKARFHNLMKHVHTFAGLIGIPQMPLKVEMAILLGWERMKESPLPFVNATFLHRLRNIGLEVQTSPDQIVLDPFHDTANVQAAMTFITESTRLQRDGRIKASDALDQAQALGKDIIARLVLQRAEPAGEEIKFTRTAIEKNDEFETAMEHHMQSLASLDWDSPEASMQWILAFAELLNTLNVTAQSHYPAILTAYRAHGFTPRLTAVSDERDREALKKAIIEELLQYIADGDELIGSNQRYLDLYRK